MHADRKLIVRIVAAVAGIALLAVGLGYVSGRDDAPDTSDISQHVQQSMQNTLDTDPSFSSLGLRVVKVAVVNSSGNEYRGVATVRTPRGSERDVAVDVTADGQSFVWRTEPGAFLFAAQGAPSTWGG